jgi:M6 family metalloprotease-like protein
MNPMDHQKKIVLLLFASTALFSCAQVVNTTFASRITQGQLQLTMKRNSLVSGSDFFDGLGITLSWEGNDVSGDSQTIYNITKDGKSYGAGDILTESGNYQASITYGEDIINVFFQVTSSQPVEASEGVGYQTVSAESVEQNRVTHYDQIGALGGGKTPSVGHTKLLVIPIGFSDTPAFTTSEISAIQNAYFGEATSTGWQSLASYYKTSSYGKLLFEGKVVSPYTYSMDSKSFQDAYNLSAGALTTLINSALTYAYQQGISPTDFDSDGDGYIDGLELVYKTTQPNYRETKDDKSSIWWCFTSSLGKVASVSNPQPNRYFWSLFSFIQNGFYNPDIDVHTLAHESGHMLGLNDYYSYDRKNASPNEYPLGGADMMDMNVGDHNAYSKYLLGWIQPKYIDGSASDFNLTLKPFETSGDCLILKDTKTDPWNGTPYDEYLMLQYYTPTELNAIDSDGYQEWTSGDYQGKTGHGGTFAKSGLQVFHVDNRVVNFNGSIYSSSTNKLVSEVWNYTDAISNERPTYNSRTDEVVSSPSYQVSSNTDTYSRSIVDHKLVSGSSVREIEILPGDGIDHFGSHSTRNLDYFGVQSNLFGLPEYGAGSSGYSNFKEKDLFALGTSFNDGSTLNYSFSVVKQSDSSITLHFVENQ